ncbi:MAG: adenylate/guanylate cyclase domain-containing protein [Paracoccaceae bacterium]
MTQIEIPTTLPSGPASAIAQTMLKLGLEGAEQEEVLEQYCHALIDIGVPLMRLHVAQSAFHPRYGGVGFDWTRSDGLKSEQYEYTETPRERWQASPLYHLLQTQELEMRIVLKDSNQPSTYPLLNDLRQLGATDYFATGLVLNRFDTSQPIDPDNTPEGVLLSWTSDGAEGFSDHDIDQIRSVLPYLGLALKSASNRKMARELLGVYLGKDAGNRVLSGEIERGSLEKIDAAICYFDLIGFTSLAERLDGDTMINMLNAYFGVAVRIIEGIGGHVLKFMGDGLMAMFDLGDASEDAEAALQAAQRLTTEMNALNEKRGAAGLPTAGFTLALHNGEIFYGNIGADSRLDFTVIGPAVNQTARLSDMHRALGQNIVVSERLRRAAGADRPELVSLGRYMLRGVPQPQELFTIHTTPEEPK